MPAGPLRHAARKVYLAARHFPSFVVKFDDHSHRSGADDSPFAFRDVRNLHNFAVNQCGHRADSNRVANTIDVPPKWRLPVIDILRGAKHFEIEPRPSLAPDINSVTLIEIDSPPSLLRLPTEPINLR